MLNRQEIRNALPYGFLSVIAARAGVSSAVVTNWFRRSNCHNPKVQKAALEVLAEHVAAEKAAEQQLEAVLRGEKI